uniref:Neur_chan_LBD domain-containing protein n=1 Tax=Mesocestoides corti TaxID=53468 RepID=A0A5K3EHY6_MESCO
TRGSSNLVSQLPLPTFGKVNSCLCSCGTKVPCLSQVPAGIVCHVGVLADFRVVKFLQLLSQLNWTYSRGNWNRVKNMTRSDRCWLPEWDTPIVTYHITTGH